MHSSTVNGSTRWLGYFETYVYVLDPSKAITIVPKVLSNPLITCQHNNPVMTTCYPNSSFVDYTGTGGFMNSWKTPYQRGATDDLWLNNALTDDYDADMASGDGLTSN
jgi:hypothetical protein